MDRSIPYSISVVMHIKRNPKKQVVLLYKYENKSSEKLKQLMSHKYSKKITDSNP